MSEKMHHVQSCSNRWKDRQIDRQTGRQIDRQTGRQTDRQSNRLTGPPDVQTDPCSG